MSIIVASYKATTLSQVYQNSIAGVYQITTAGDSVRKHSLPLEVAEHDEWGYTHAVVGGELARAWGLGEWLECLIETHHDSTYSSLCRRECALITVADHLATVQQYAIERNPLMYPLDAEVLILAGWAGPESPLDVLPLADGQYATLARALA